MMDFELSERRVVEQAARKRTTIQQAPAIITVITAKEIKDRGYRTLNDVLRTIPGFEGDRWEFNGWFKDSLTRGIPGTTLVLLDGVNIVEPTRNVIVLDRKIPLEIVKRVEVTSGPGSVLWGSNALLGVINIITHDGASKPGVEYRIGGGGGPGARASGRAHMSYGGSWLDGDLRAFVGVTYYNTDGPELTVDEPLILGPLPAPAQDGSSLLGHAPATSSPVNDDHFLNVATRLSWGPVTLSGFTGFEAERRELGSGGSVLTQDPSLITSGSDQLHNVRLRYYDRFASEDFGVNFQAYWTNWQLHENPSGIFPRSIPLETGGKTSLESEKGTTRTGFNVDFDWHLPFDNHLLVGGEIFADVLGDVQLTSFYPLVITQDECVAIGFQYRPDLDPERPCSLEQQALVGQERYVGAFYAQDAWKLSNRIAVNLGFRGQFATTYDPSLSVSAGFVTQLTDLVFLKATYSEGFRPPDFQSTATRAGVATGVTVEANPDLDVESSRAVETEINAVLFENSWPIRQLYLRADYSFTRMENVIVSPGGRFVNSGLRDIHSVELLGKLHFYGDHELWLSYYFVDVVDSDLGRLRNIANHIINAGARASLFGGHLQLMSVLTVRGSMEDLNRTQDSPLPGLGPVEIAGASWVGPTGLEVTEIPTAILLRVGVEARDLWNVVDVGAWVYNVLDVQYSDPDFFFDDRIMTRPQPKPGLSFFLQGAVRW